MAWRPTWRQVLWTLPIVVVMLILGLVGWWLWGVLEGYIQPKTPAQKKDLVNIFVLIAAGVVGALTALAAVGNLTVSRRNLEQQRELDERSAQDDALQKYFEHMGTLVPEIMETIREDDPLRMLARAQTLTVSGRVDATRRARLVLFLFGAGLIRRDKPYVDLLGACFAGADLRGAVLNGVNLTGVDLSHAVLREAQLINSFFAEARLCNADLRRAKLNEADLRYVDLHRANLSGAVLNNAQLQGAKLIGADLSRSNLHNTTLSNVDLSNACLAGAQLVSARFEHGFSTGPKSLRSKLDNADLSNANLAHAHLYAVDFDGANLAGANLRQAKVVKEQLAKAKSLQGAIMPDGSHA